MKNFTAIKKGSYYRRRDGHVVGPAIQMAEGRFYLVGHNYYNQWGTADEFEPHTDLIEEVTVTPVEAPKPREPRECWVAYIKPQDEPRHAVAVKQPKYSREYEWVHMREVIDE